MEPASKRQGPDVRRVEAMAMTRPPAHQRAEANTTRRLAKARAKIPHLANARGSHSGTKASEAKEKVKSQHLMIG